jgi:hypothetical protein
VDSDKPPLAIGRESEATGCGGDAGAGQTRADGLTVFKWLVVFAVGLLITALLAISALLLIRFAQESDMPSDITSQKWRWIFLAWAAVGGLFGGSTRALFKLIYEFGDPSMPERGKSGANQGVAFYYERLCLYLLKCPLGGAAGVLFFLVVHVGLVNAVHGEPHYAIQSVTLVSALGGYFFESSIAALESLLKHDRT